MEKTEKEFWGKEVTKNNLVWPNEQVIRFIKRNVSDINKTILDFGCGAGRNSIALAGEGYNIIAIDCTQDAVDMLKEKAKDKSYNIKCLVNSNENQVPLEANSIDAIIADGSLFYNNFEDTIKLLNELRKSLVNGGLIWADWRSTDEYLYGMGKEIEKNYFEMNELSARLGARYHFFDKETLKDVYEQAGLDVISIDVFEYTEQNGKKKNSWFHVIAKNIN